MRHAAVIFRDFVGIVRICGLSIGVRWLAGILLNIPAILSAKNLQPADRAVGKGPFRIRHCGTSFLIAGSFAMSGVREMYVRDTYFRRGMLKVNVGDTVLDLGANIGNFTNLALACGAGRVVAVEPRREYNSMFRDSVGLNKGFLERVTLVRAFLGSSSTPTNPMAPSTECPDEDAPWIAEDQLLKQVAVDKIDFLKCDIEGGEFSLLSRESALLAMTQSLAMEVHSFAGDVAEFIRNLELCGFRILLSDFAPDGSSTVLATRKHPA